MRINLVNNKEAWQMTRQEWHKNNKKYYGINWHKERESTEFSFVPNWEISEKAEIKAINDYIGTFKNIYNTIHKKLGQIEPLQYEKDRDWDFADSKWIMQVKSNIRAAYQNDIIWVEDAREAIILGRRLGYRETDILTYIIRTYIPDLFKIMIKGRRIPKKYFMLFPNLKAEY